VSIDPEIGSSLVLYKLFRKSVFFPFIENREIDEPFGVGGL
jgi:hypothetical protein